MSEEGPSKGTWIPIIRNIGIIIAAVLSLIKIYDWISAPSQKLNAEVTYSSFLLPPDVKAAFRKIDSLSTQQTIKKEIDSDKLLRFSSPQARELAEKLIERFSDVIQSNFSKLPFGKYETGGSYLFQVKVRNVGSKALSTVTLTMPEFLCATIKRPGEETRELGSGEIIRIGILQPREEIMINSWSRYAFSIDASPIRITHDSGVGRVIFLVPTGPFGQWADRYWSAILTALIGLVAVVIAIYIASKQ